DLSKSKQITTSCVRRCNSKKNKPIKRDRTVVEMANVKQLVDNEGIEMTDLQIKQLTHIIEEMETEFNRTNDDDEFGLTDLYINEDDELVIVCMEEMIRQSTTVERAILDKLNTSCSETEFNAIATNIKNEISM